MASSSGDEETSVESLSPASIRQASRQEPALASANASDGPVAQLDLGFPQKGEWLQYKSVMRKIYVEENQTLAQVRDHMRRNYGFIASIKMFKSRFIAWGWRKNIKLTVGLDPRHVQETPYEDSVRPGTKIRLANGQIVDTSRLQRHLRRKMVYTRVPLTAVVRPPDSHHITEAVFAYTRTYAFGRHETEITCLSEALRTITLDEPMTSRWFSFAGEVNTAMKQQDVSRALVTMRRAPEEVAIMFRSHPSTTICNIFSLIVQLNGHAEAATGTDAEQFRILLKALLRYAASLGFSGALGLPNTHPLPHLMQSLALVPHSELGEVAIRAWKVCCQAWAEMTFPSTVSGVGSKSLRTWLRVSDRGDMEGMWFFRLIEGMINEQMEAFEQMYGKRDFRYIETLQSKADLLSFVAMGQGRNCYTDPRIIAIYQQMAEHAVRGPRWAAALDFLAKGYEQSIVINQGIALAT
ncbi:hypothetical protein KVR01_013605 [Diaporthe batatas]|uniref:uncharacterized protein n=1 Tax=Diaporthe batatas TaxID=748121 RepID=UPI001D04EEF4|nr:uncharacterized protein KVR01_013605 [Diaporthe batatas]KAG8156501.1 hypothetical protein KVR01_013605 [Diaporthe batatas]